MISTSTSMVACSAFTSGVLVIWLAILCAPWPWMSADNAVAHVDINPWYVSVDKGSILGMVPGRFRKVLDMVHQDMWMVEATQRFCTPVVDNVFNWCNMWVRAKWASYFLLFFAFLSVLFFGLAISCMLYYHFQNKTYKGRQWAQRFLLWAPCSMFLGLCQYTLLTWDFGDFSAMMLYSSRGAYNASFVVAWILLIPAVFPLFVQRILTRGDKNEKRGPKDQGEDADAQQSNYDPNQGYSQGGYGVLQPGPYGYDQSGYNNYAAAPPGPGYGAPPPGYDQSGYNAGGYGAPPGPGYNAGGYGGPPAPGYDASGYGAPPSAGAGVGGAPAPGAEAPSTAAGTGAPAF